MAPEAVADKPDYENCLDAEVWAFVADTMSFYDAVLSPYDWPAIRACYDRMTAYFHHGRPAGLSVQDRVIAGVPVRIYGRDETGTLLFAHGGGFVMGGLDSHDDICAELAARTGRRVISVDYRLALEHPHPAAFEDLSAVADALLERGPILLCGDSAGATLCAAYAGVSKAGGLQGQVLIYPSLGYPMAGGSYDRHANAPLLSRDEMGTYRDAVAAEPNDPRLNPSLGNLARVPQTWAFAAECDPLADDATRYCAEIADQGGHAHAFVQKGLVHGWLRARHRSTRAAQAFDEIVSVIAAVTRT